MRCVFQISTTNTPNHYPELKICISCLPLWAGNSYVVQVQDCDLEYFFVDLTRRIALSEKKLPLIKVLIQIADIDIRL